MTVEVSVSIFAGGDVLHIDSRIKDPIMHKVRQRYDGSWQRAPTTSEEWQTKLWREWGREHPGVQLQFGKWPTCKQHAQALCLTQLRAFFSNAPQSTIVLVMGN